MFEVGDQPVAGFCLQRFLGSGSFGQVWQASGPGDTRAALKIINVAGEAGLKEFRGIQRVKELHHPHLMPITGIWLLDQLGHPMNDAVLKDLESAASSNADSGAPRPTTMIVAMLLASGNLEQRLKECQSHGERGIPVAELLEYLEEAAKGIDFLNGLRQRIGGATTAVQHGDIKPENILLAGGSAMIADFGVARLLGKGTQSQVLGSPQYMAPECFGGNTANTSDQYALAITYVQLRTGEVPIDAKTPMAIMHAHANGEIDLAGLPEAEQNVIQQAIALNPEERFNSCAEMVQQLRRASTSSERITMYLEVSALRQRKWRTRIALTAATTLVIGLAVFGVYWMTRTADVPNAGVASKPPVGVEPVREKEKETGDGDTTLDHPADPPKTDSEPPSGPPRIYSHQEIITCVADDLNAAAPEDRANYRYLTLPTHAARQPDSTTESAERRVLETLLGVWKDGDRLPLVAVGLDDTVLRLDMTSIGWDADVWNTLVRASPYSYKSNHQLIPWIEERTGSVSPTVRADWWIHAVAAGQLKAILPLDEDQRRSLQDTARFDDVREVVNRYRAALKGPAIAAEFGRQDLRASSKASFETKSFVFAATRQGSIARRDFETHYRTAIVEFGFGDLIETVADSTPPPTTIVADPEPKPVDPTSPAAPDPQIAGKRVSEWINDLVMPAVTYIDPNQPTVSERTEAARIETQRARAVSTLRGLIKSRSQVAIQVIAAANTTYFSPYPQQYGGMMGMGDEGTMETGGTPGFEDKFKPFDRESLPNENAEFRAQLLQSSSAPRPGVKEKKKRPKKRKRKKGALLGMEAGDDPSLAGMDGGELSGAMGMGGLGAMLAGPASSRPAELVWVEVIAAGGARSLLESEPEGSLQACQQILKDPNLNLAYGPRAVALLTTFCVSPGGDGTTSGIAVWKKVSESSLKTLRETVVDETQPVSNRWGALLSMATAMVMTNADRTNGLRELPTLISDKTASLDLRLYGLRVLCDYFTTDAATTIPVLATLLETESLESTLRIWSAWAMRSLGERSRQVKPLDEMLSAGSLTPAETLAVVDLLAWSEEKAAPAMPTVLKTLDRVTSTELDLSAALAATNTIVAAGGDKEEALQLLARLLEDERLQVQARAWLAFWIAHRFQQDAEPAVPEILKFVQANANASIHEFAFSETQIDPPLVTSVLSPSPQARYQIGKIILAQGMQLIGPSSMPVLIELINQLDYNSVRTVRTLGEPAKAAIPALQNYIKSQAVDAARKRLARRALDELQGL
jgi:serine/threonine protein kinase